MNRIYHYTIYHLAMQIIGDCDPQYPALDYIADRFELNIEQRYWLSFLYQATYCAPTVFYIYNEFPDYENVDIRRLENWWRHNKNQVLFQTDRAKVKNFDKFVPMFDSYRKMVGESQRDYFEGVIYRFPDKKTAYKELYKQCNTVYYVGRFSLFLWLESMHRLTGLLIYPDTLDLRNADSCRNGLCYVLGKDEWVKNSITKEHYIYLTTELNKIVDNLNKDYNLPIDHWSIETSLCAFKKLFWKKRYLGYYIDRMQKETLLMEKNVPNGVCWQVLWDFRREYFNHQWLGEIQGWEGIRKDKMGLPSKELLAKALNQSYKQKVKFRKCEAYY